MKSIDKAYALFVRAMNALQPPFLLLIRLYWGWQFFETGLGKVRGIDHVIEFFISLGIPLPVFNAYFVSYLEMIGGILLILGLGSRIIGAMLSFDMIVAYLTADREALKQVFSDPGKFYNAAPFTFLLASLIVLVFGPGLFAVDTWIARRSNRIARAGSAR